MNNVLKLATLARYVVGNRGAARLPKGACSLYGTPLVLFERPPLQQPFKCSSSSSPSLAVRSMQKTEVRHSICLRRVLATMEEGMERERETDRQTDIRHFAWKEAHHGGLLHGCPEGIFR